MTFKRFVDIATVVFCCVVLAAIFLHSCQRQKLKAEIESFKSELEYVQQELKKKRAGDCILESTEYGYKCTDQNGKVFKVKL